MDESIKGRVRLWLRSERAMGLHSLPLRDDGMLTPAVEGLPAPAQVLPVAAPRAAGAVSGPLPGTPARGQREGLSMREALPGTQSKSPPPQLSPRRTTASEPASPPVIASSSVDLFISPDKAPLTGPVLPRAEKERLLSELNQRMVCTCRKCILHEQRTHTVFGEGDVDAQLMFIGEGPGETEDQTGRPFVGRAGQKLDDMIAAMGLRREQVYICNIVKCRPPGNRQPVPDEIETCTPYLLRQIEIIRPKVIVTLGLPATQFMLGTKNSMSSMRGRWYEWRGIKLMPTFHPSYILRVYTVETRKAVWSDLQKVMAELGLKASRKTNVS